MNPPEMVAYAALMRGEKALAQISRDMVEVSIGFLQAPIRYWLLHLLGQLLVWAGSWLLRYGRREHSGHTAHV
jgi:hypothetical protein